MKLIHLPIFALLVSSILCQYDYDPFFSYYDRASLAGSPYPICSVECDCPLNFPTAMYCNHRKLKTIPMVPAQIKYLYLQNNQLDSIPNGAFENATGLLWLVLDDNQINSENVGKNAFSKLKSLQRLYINHNNLTDVVRSLPKSLVQLKLASNKISKIGNSLKGLENLTTLILFDNNLNEVGGSLSSLKSLTYLDLSLNKLTKLPDDPPAAIEMFYINHNKINNIPKDYFNKMNILQYLRMSYNELTDEGIPEKVFNITSLIELDLAFNELKSIPLVNENLENLYLQANKIDKFTLNSFCRITSPTDFSKIKHLRLDGNNITRRSLPNEMSQCLRVAGDISVDF
ncbi:lumican [Carcharodon carcharias]|uniref:lumican n=1 Tax=Carcharodon carcharias TaxID=13397 RepID=UPI001B7F65EB|nr:lumican [Carcharodon carcharias]XP_041072073.1 lumican [Carcharodon carcharias]